MSSQLRVINIDDVPSSPAPTVYSVHSSPDPEPVARSPRSSEGDEGLIRFTTGDYQLPGDSTDPERDTPERMAFIWKACIAANNYTKAFGILPPSLDWPVQHHVIAMVERNTPPDYDDLNKAERDGELY